MSLHREVIAPYRGVWARIWIAIALGAAATAAICDHRTTALDRERRVVEQRTRDARREAAEAAARVEVLRAQLDAVARRIAEPPGGCPGELDRRRAEERLAQLKRQRDEMVRRIAEARAARRD